MNNIVFEKVCKSYGKVEVIRDLDLEIPEGQRLILLGPSGCGKTTILRMIAGLEPITSGNLYMGGERMNDVEPGDRNVAMVFQNYALYPTMNVFDNIAFPLRNRHFKKKEIEGKVLSVAKLLHIEDILKGSVTTNG